MLKTTRENSSFEVERLGEIMSPETGNDMEAEGVLNPAAARGPDGQLYLFPRLAAKNNFSRIGMARVLFDKTGVPVGVERQGVALEPSAEYEMEGCEDPRISFVEPLGLYVMTYSAVSPRGPRIAFATSRDLRQWHREGLAEFSPYRGISFDSIDNKDASMFPVLVPNPSHRPAMAIMHRPLFPGSRPEELQHEPKSRFVDVHRESIWISYCHKRRAEGSFCQFASHHRLASPVEPWEHLKIGAGTPPVLIRHGWLIVYHGVRKVADEGPCKGKQCYSAGVMVLDRNRPSHILYRASHPVLAPDPKTDRRADDKLVVFPTGIDRRDDLGKQDTFDIYFGMGDSRIGCARLTVPDKLDFRPVADPPHHRLDRH